ncbi:MAG: type II secretion system protein [Candidatus Gracilibacteria bacterium]|nr:type II secretion system protein [Candidatus Gracilibacteria bacterium]
MKRFSLLKKGFTLVEMLVVISIVAILSVLAVSGYTSFRKASLIDLSADALIAQIDEMKEKAIHGTKGGVDEDGAEFLRCYGLEISKGGESGYEIGAVSYKFTNKKVWKDARWQYEGCANEDEEAGIFEMDSMVSVSEITMKGADGGVETDFTGDNIVFRFAPPNGDLEILEVAGAGGNFSGKILIKIVYGNDDNYSRIVEIDSASGKAVKKYDEKK